MRALTLAEATHLKRVSGSALTIAEITRLYCAPAKKEEREQNIERYEASIRYL